MAIRAMSMPLATPVSNCWARNSQALIPAPGGGIARWRAAQASIMVVGWGWDGGGMVVGRGGWGAGGVWSGVVGWWWVGRGRVVGGWWVGGGMEYVRSVA